MSHWNHRIIKTTQGGEDLFSVHEVQYDSAGKPASYTDEPVVLDGMPHGELLEALSMLSLATAMPVLVLADFPVPDEAANDPLPRLTLLHVGS